MQFVSVELFLKSRQKSEAMKNIQMLAYRVAFRRSKIRKKVHRKNTVEC